MINFGDKRRQLLKISNAATCTQQGSVGPRIGAAIVAGAVTAAVTSTMHLSWPISLGSALAVVALAYHYLPTRKSWFDSLDNLLTAYDPVNLEAYAELHRITREQGGLQLSAVFEWIDREQDAILALAPKAAPGTGSKFINKPVAPIGKGRND